MIAMCMRDKDVADVLIAHGIEQSGDVFVIRRARIDDRDIAAPDDVGHRPLECERARIPRAERTNAGGKFFHLARNEIECAVEGNVFGHWRFVIGGHLSNDQMAGFVAGVIRRDAHGCVSVLVCGKQNDTGF